MILEQLKNYKRFISIGANKSVLYTRNIGEDHTDYRDMWISKGATVRPDGSIDISTVIREKITKDNKAHGLLSQKSNKRVNDIIDWMVLLSKEKTTLNHELKSFYKWKLNFITLTLPSKQRHSDKIIKSELLNDFLVQLKRKFSIKYYFWRAESQSNGNIHFHIITDKFVPWQWCRDKWNHVVNKLDYVNQFEQKHKHNTPNSTDIHSLQNIKNISKYLSKYCSKSSKGITVMCSLGASNFPHAPVKYNYKINSKTKFYRQVHGKLWGCSELLSKLKKCVIQVPDEVQKVIVESQYAYPHKYKFFDYVTIINFKATELIQAGLSWIRDRLAEYVQSIINPQLSILTHGSL